MYGYEPWYQEWRIALKSMYDPHWRSGFYVSIDETTAVPTDP
jgi:hypothetical protein